MQKLISNEGEEVALGAPLKLTGKVEHYLGGLIGAIRNDLLARMQQAIADDALTPTLSPNPSPNPNPSSIPSPRPRPNPNQAIADYAKRERREWLFDHLAQLSIVIGTQLEPPPPPYT